MLSSSLPLLLPLLLLSFSVSPLYASTCQSQSFSYSALPTKNNPLRGFVSYLDSSGDGSFPSSLEYTYVAMNSLMTGPSSFNFSVLESSLSSVASRDKNLIFRLYLDYPDCCPDGEYHTGVPEFLTQGENPVTFEEYDDYGGGFSPDYSNQRLIDAMVALIEAMGEEYDGDGRIAFIQVGLLGFWGEFHTYPHDSWMAPREVQLAVFNAFNSSFTQTHFLVSIDELNYWEHSDANNKTSGYSIGWHDDSFLEDTYSATDSEDWYWYPRAEERHLLDAYLRLPMGGEVYPDHQGTAFTPSWSGMDFEACVEKTHVSWLLNQHPFDLSGSSAEKTATIEASLLLGYQFFLSEIRMVDVSACGDEWCGTVEVDLQNKGSAPFYYPIDLKGSITVSGSTTEVFSFSLQRFAPSSTLKTFRKSTSWSSDGEDPVLSIKLESAAVSRPIVFAHEGAKLNGIVTLALDPSCPFSSAPSLRVPSLLLMLLAGLLLGPLFI